MNIMMVRMFGFIFLTCSSVSCYAQMSPVAWSFEAQIDSSNVVKFVAKATIEKGWYIYNVGNTTEGPIDTQVKFDLQDGQVILKNIDIRAKLDVFLDPIYLKMVSTLRGFVQISQKITDANGKGIVKGNIIYMACDKSKCLPPASISFDLVVK